MQGIPQGQNQGGSQKPSLSWSGPGASKPAPMPKSPPPQKPAGTKGGEEKSNMTTYVGIFVAGVIVGGLLGWAALGGHPGGSLATDTTGSGTGAMATATTTDNGTSMTGSSMTSGLQGLTIASGQDAGATIAVSSISVNQPTWVVIYDDESGAPGRTLGAQLFFPVSQGGETSGTVSLIRSTLGGHSYLAGERIDDGDHVYNTENDHQVLDANGQPLTVMFTTK